ncbi:TraB/GumN family protein [Devosia sediminis]|uniref:TraB/GumN family protein n=1 Tax=Devosia sediminis TaxID=2798801 RepID=A0A934MRK8_9HYPH|nr:TraB/GumN family protein [Devosia sediminis]MBJ3785524.1 TraB/GumN family protein [Devosia sediminis]
MLKISTMLLATAALIAPAAAAPAIWKVSDADSSVWLFGSVHMLRADTDWRTQRLDKLISKADRVYFEADISAAAQVEIMPISMELGFNRDGVLLSEQIGPELTDRVRDAAAEYGLPMPALLTMKPWLAATTLGSGPLLDSGFEAIHGVEMVLGEELPAERKGFLETAEEQLGFLSSGTLDEQITMLEATLDTLPMAKADVETMISAWMDGDPETLGEAFDSQTVGYDAKMVDRIIDIRNHNWVEKIETMLGDNEAALIVVGAAHLAGDVSVVKLLEERGFSSERVQ